MPIETVVLSGRRGRRQRVLDRPRPLRARRPRPRAGRDAGPAGRRGGDPPDRRRGGAVEARRRGDRRWRRRSRPRCPSCRRCRSLRDAAARRAAVDVRLPAARPAGSTRTGCCCATGSGTSSVATTSTTSQRTYRVDRIEGDVDDRARRDVRAAGRLRPPRPPSRATRSSSARRRRRRRRCASTAGRAAGVERELGSERVVRRHADGSIDVEVPCANVPAFRSWVLGLRRPRRGARPAGRAGAHVDRVAAAMAGR